jgi:hypothetical protein
MVHSRDIQEQNRLQHQKFVNLLMVNYPTFLTNVYVAVYCVSRMKALKV